MFQRRELSSPGRMNRTLTILVPNRYDYSQIASPGERERLFKEEKEVPNELRPLLSRNIYQPLESTYAELVRLTTAYLNHIRDEAAGILKICPLAKLKEIQEIQVANNPRVKLELTISGATLIFDCKNLSKLLHHVDGWIDNPAKKIVFKKLSHIAHIYHFLREENDVVNKITGVKTYIEKKGVCRDMRTPRTENVLPGDTRGGVYMNTITPLIYNCYIEIENSTKAADVTILNRQTSLRLEWYTLNYLNVLTDYTLKLLKKLPATDLTQLHERSTQIKDDNRFILVEHPLAPEREKEGVKEFRIHCSILESWTEYFPSNVHYHLEKCAYALELLSQIEEVNDSPEKNKIETFFKGVNHPCIQDYMRNRFICCSFFKIREHSIDAKFLSNVKCIQQHHEAELARLEQEKAPEFKIAGVQG
jgi:hypothetical protein